ncbi:MAG: putative periplasmic solute-binding protein [Parcubacteria group bacterium GW2011_GWF2_44_8b]|nr:MAG: putative periplasmic solute-binding protein [Parcubacteria group bacterium GW2011_GWC1_43_30]KKT78987.1 MAG: putative periplasmic solute-binding protein [Parcubacteria group bacterium GW2011_GWF2_44_8b]KKT86143.1 MAG: putative periplasmic solute-binding protein [Parcubacteria group bacterium GW2011_GWD1_44_9]
MLRPRLFFIGIVLFIIFFFPTTPPFSFPSGSIVTIPEGVGLYTLAERLREDRVIRSPFWFRAVAIILGGERDMKAGQYLMSGPQNVFFIAWRVFHGDYDIETVKLTIPEGFTVREISKLFDERFVFFDHADFVEHAPEGYLFPDTYFIPVIATASSTIKLLGDNFTHKIVSSMPDIESSGRTLKEIIIMASLLEAETKTKEDREIVSDILWKRLKLRMPLQVDSDMGTYEFVGLPENPINNPGLVSIDAALHPTSTPYLYFLTGDDGTMHYSRTFDEHVAKKLKYIK